MHETILVLDAGSRLTQLIARHIRSAGVYCEIVPMQRAGQALADQLSGKLKGIVISNHDALESATDALPVPATVFEAGVPLLAIGYGCQAMVQHFGGRSEATRAANAQRVTATVRARGHTRLLDGIQDTTNAAGHGLLDVARINAIGIQAVPAGFVTMATTAADEPVAVADEGRGFYGLLFHPEAAQTRQGEAIMHRFVREICECSGDWNMHDYIGEAVAAIRQQVAKDRVLLGLSGGVDSSVAAALIHKAIGDQLTCVFVDHGLLRQNEAAQVMQMMGNNLGIAIRHVDASAQFMQCLQGEMDPEAKRKIIGREFIEVFQHEARQLVDVQWLAQGTIYPDVIESASSQSGQSVAVKSHHNVGGLPETLNLKLLEPLRELFKHEVRELGLALGLPAEMVYRHPFPGPGLGVRILGEVTQAHAETLRQADAIFIEELRQTQDEHRQKSWYDLTSQAFAVLLPVRSVGVQEGARVYAPVIALRAVETVDFMTATWARLPYDLLETVSTRIIREVPGVSRVVYDVCGKPPATIEWE